jgi:hypothetical protein
MMLAGFAGIGLASYRRSLRGTRRQLGDARLSRLSL